MGAPRASSLRHPKVGARPSPPENAGVCHPAPSSRGTQNHWPPSPRARSHLLVFLLLGREAAGHGTELEVGAGQLM